MQCAINIDIYYTLVDIYYTRRIFRILYHYKSGTICLHTGSNRNSFVQEVASAYAIFLPKQNKNKGGEKQEKSVDWNFFSNDWWKF